MNAIGGGYRIPWRLLVGLAAAATGCGVPSDRIDTPSIDFDKPVLGAFSQLHGPLYVEEGEFQAQADRLPWSGYWYPLSRIDARSALEKYDYLTGNDALNSEIARVRNEGRPLLPWEGRCDAWAIASILTAEPRSPKEIRFRGRKATLTVAEQKALKILSHESIDPSDRSIFGVRNDGQGGDAFEDLSPAEFHRIIQVMLIENRRPFIMDRDPMPPVWNTPVVGARWSITPDRTRTEWMQVHAWVYTVFPYDSDLDSTDRIAPVLEYHYELKVQRLGSGRLRVIDSQWTGRSISSHPDFVTILGENSEVSARSLNPEIDSNWIREHLDP